MFLMQFYIPENRSHLHATNPKFWRVSKSANELVEDSTGAEVGQRFIFHQEFLRAKKLSSRFGASQIS
jgi:hypothetical protein